MPNNVFTVHGAYPEPLWHGCAYTMVPHSQLRFLPYVGVVHSTVYLHCTVYTYIYRIFHAVHWGRGGGEWLGHLG